MEEDQHRLENIKMFLDGSFLFRASYFFSEEGNKEEKTVS